MQTDTHSGRRMLGLVREVCEAAEELDEKSDDLTLAEAKLDLELLKDLAADYFGEAAVLERLISGARRN